MSSATGARMPRDERREQLLVLGARQVAAGSFDDLSLDQVASDAGISRSLLFHYFPSRLDFVVAIAEDAAAQLLEVTDVGEEPSPAVTLRRGLEAFVGHIEERAASYVSLVRGALGGEPALRAVSDRTRATIAGRVVEALVGMGTAPTAELRLAVRGWVAYVEEAVVVWLAERDPARARLIEHLERVLFAAVALDRELLEPAKPAEPAARGAGPSLGS